MSQLSEYYAQQETATPETADTAKKEDALAQTLVMLGSGKIDADSIMSTYSAIESSINPLQPIHPEVENTMAENRGTSTPAARKTLMEDPNIPIEKKKDWMEAWTSPTEDYYATPKEEAENMLIQSGVSGSPWDDPDLAEMKEYKADTIEERLAAKVVRQQMVNKWGATLNSSGWDTTVGTAAYIVPFLEQTLVSLLKRNPELGDIASVDMLTMGEMKQALRNNLDRLPAREQIQETQRVLDALSHLPGADFNKYMLMNEILNEEGYGTGWQYLDNAISALDATVAGAVIGRAALALTRPVRKWLAGKSMPDSMFGKMAEHDPEVAAEAAKMVIKAGDQGEEAAAAMGTSKGEILADTTLPAPTKDVAEKAPSDVADMITGMEKSRAEMADQAEQVGFNMTAAERKAEMKAEAENLAVTPGVSLRNNNTHLKDNGKSFDVTARFGRNKKHFFGTYEKALESAKKTFNMDDPGIKVTIEKMNPTDEVWEVAKAGDKRGQYSISVEYRQAYKGDQVQLFGDKAFNRYWTDGSYWSEKAIQPMRETKVASWLTDPNTRFIPDMIKGALRGKDITSRIEHRMVEELRAAFKPLKKKSVSKVTSFLSQMTDDLMDTGKTKYTYQDLLLHDKFSINHNEAKAILAYQETQKTLATLRNKQYKTILERGGYKHIEFADGSNPYMYGKVIDEPMGVAKEFAIDFGENAKTMKLEGDALQAFLDAGGKVVKMRSPMLLHGNKFEYALVEPGKAKIKDIPDWVFPIIPGHVSRLYDEYYQVNKTYTQGELNGFKNTADPNEKPVAMYGSKREAKEAVERLTAENKTDGAIFSFTELREFRNSDDIVMAEHNILTETERLASAEKRGEHLQGAFNGKARIDDPLRSVFRDIQVVSQKLGIEDWLNVTKSRLKGSYPQLVDSKGQLPKTMQEVDEKLRKSGVSADEAAVVRDLTEYIAMVENRPTKYDNGWYSIVFATAQVLDGIKDGKVSRWYKDVALRYDPINTFKSVKFAMFIQGRPLRQALLQSSQLLQYPIFAPGYAKFTPDLMAMSSIIHGIKGSENLAGVTSFTKKELIQIAEDFADSGLAESVRTHPVTATTARGVYSAPIVKNRGFNLSRAHDVVFNQLLGKGFEHGELLNLMGAYLVAHREFVKKNGKLALKDSAIAKDEIAARARVISHAMNSAGKFNYQRGLFSGAMQFAAAPHKAFLQILTNKALTMPQRVAAAGLNLFMFGENALSIGRIMDTSLLVEGMEMNDAQKDAYAKFKLGMINTMGNALLSEIAGYETKVDFSSGISPTEGWYDLGLEFLINIMTKPLPETLGATPAMDYVSNLRAEANVLFRGFEHELIDSDKVAYLGSAIASFAGGWSDAKKAYFAMQYGTLTNSKGRPAVNDVGMAEAVAALFGLKHQREREIRKVMDKNFDKQKMMKEDAQRVAAAIDRIYTQEMGNTSELDRRVHYQIVGEFSWYPEEDRAQMKEYLLREFGKGKKDGSHQLFQRFMERSFNPETQINELRQYIPALPPRMRPQAREMIKEREALMKRRGN